jgi:hypothetical protein
MEVHELKGEQMQIKHCEFDQPVEKRSSTALYSGMFNEDVGFRFLVDVKVTDRQDVESMLKLFERATTDFKEVWQKVLANLR